MKSQFYPYPYRTRIHYAKENASLILSHALKEKINDQCVIICVGTDRCIGDALGPLVGTLLKDKNFRLPVYGTLDEPIHAINLEESISKIKSKHPKGFFIAIDACLGNEDLIGHIHIKKGPISPGKGVGKSLPNIGNLSIIGIVDQLNHEDCFSIHSIRLNLVMKMAQVIVDALKNSTYLS
ncbi:spore protease YyaC [Anaerophilus nitritogenes]|uniref:spore protease YyaC n=1 Tax=Anaerophilus nitritogenes TaxID=2498136 RepID=UPI0019310708|nr:spore protease YyaC [Anaerophilus nitritogenes]